MFPNRLWNELDLVVVAVVLKSITMLSVESSFCSRLALKEVNAQKVLC